MDEVITVEQRYQELYEMADLMYKLGELHNAHRCLIKAFTLFGSPFVIYSH